MLILSRRPNESVYIGNNITLKVLKVVGDQVRIGIEAPKDIPVHREEVYERIKREVMEASGIGDAATIQGLPEDERRVMTLRKVYRLTQEQIAQRLNLSDEEVARLLASAALHCAAESDPELS